MERETNNQNLTLEEYLRDSFAAAALQGMLACQNADGTTKDFAKWAYDYADAMLKERSRRK